MKISIDKSGLAGRATAAEKATLAFVKNWTLPLSIVAGIVLYVLYVSIPWLDGTHRTAGRIVAVLQPVLIFTMLFLTFLKVGPRDLRLRRWHLFHVLIQLGFFALCAGVLAVFADTEYRVLVESAMLCLLCPTATAAAVVTRKLDGNPADIITYTIIINLVTAFAAPALLPVAHPHPEMTFLPSFLMILAKIFPMMILPLFSAWIVRKWLPALAERLSGKRDLAFYLWAVALTLAIAVTVKAIDHSRISAGMLSAIAGVTAACCLLQFGIGRIIGRKYHGEIESAQALGQKNTVFIIWLGYTFLSPVTAMAGGLYSVWHNVINSYQLYKRRKKAG